MAYGFKSLEGLQPGMVALVGIPFDKNSSFLKGTALAPPIIRDTLNAGSTNLCTENGIDLTNHTHFHDIGDIIPFSLHILQRRFGACVGLCAEAACAVFS